jgi:spore coat polysaccharide biosynthesis protein SpsF
MGRPIMRNLCVVQARTGSSRLPGKVLADLGGRPMLQFLLERLANFDRAAIDELVVATSTEARDDRVADIARAAGHPVVRGSEHDVLSRYIAALDAFPARNVVRITADCPLTDPQLVGAVVAHHLALQADYTSNTLPRTFPKGLDIEVVTAGALRVADAEAVTTPEREHVMPYLYRRPERFKLANLRNAVPLGHERWTVDTADDLDFVRNVVGRFDGPSDFGWRDILTAVSPTSAAPAGSFVLRPAYACDRDFVREARNDDAAVRLSGTCRPVTSAEHDAWFTARLANPGAPIWIGEVDEKRVGTVRVDVCSGVGEVGIAVHEAARGRGYGRALLAALLDELRGDQQVVHLIARIRPENTASVRAFRSVGFVDVTEGAGAAGDEFVVLARDPRLPMEEL